ncbi:MAG: hypothetical protein NZO16_03000 [Deltaproteobacteria bacterium]|nr:hypothetical protein [Deltaproteobacteria bacterium]
MLERFTVYVASFSYHLDSVPRDPFGHGGGYVIDCRVLPNPGKLEVYKDYSGLQSAVKEWLENNPLVEKFWNQIEVLTNTIFDLASSKEMFELAFCFGCTGGRHRSVYIANRFADSLKRRQATVILEHIQLKKLGLI